MMSFRILLISISLVFLTQTAFAEKFQYRYAGGDMASYSMTANGQLDLSKIAAIAAMLQITNLSENIYLVTELSAQTAAKDGSAEMKAINKQLSVVMIKNDSLRKIDNADWSYLKPGTTFNFNIDPAGRITPIKSKGVYTDKSILGVWQMLLPSFPAGSIDAGLSWTDSVVYQAGYKGTTPVNLLCHINYTYTGGDRFDYTLDGKSVQNANLHLSGKGHFTFDKMRGLLTANTCDLDLRGFVDLTQFGISSDLAANFPLAVKAQVVFKLQGTK
jgi:hypothetical protein